MPGLLFLPPELIRVVIQDCGGREQCHLRATCKILKEIADPVVFHRISLCTNITVPHIPENQIISLVTGASRACELTKDIAISWIPSGIWATAQFGHGDLRLQLSTAISALRNLTCFRWSIADWEPTWLIDSLFRAVADLPRLTELTVETSNAFKSSLPLGLFSHLSKLKVAWGRESNVSYFVFQLATAIANSPQLTSLDVTYWGLSSYGVPLPTLSQLFSILSPEKPLYLEHLRIRFMDATVDQVVLPHLTKLASFLFEARDQDLSVSRSFWTSLLANRVKLSEVVLTGIITEEAMLYLSSFSGLRRLNVDFIDPPPGSTLEPFKNVFFSEVVPKHVDSLQVLRVSGGSDDHWAFDHTNSAAIMECHELRDLYFYIDGKKDSMSVQLFIDTVSQLPQLQILRFFVLDFEARKIQLGNFKPTRGLRYVERLQISMTRYVLEKSGWYREAFW